MYPILPCHYAIIMLIIPNNIHTFIFKFFCFFVEQMRVEDQADGEQLSDSDVAPPPAKGKAL